MKTSYVISRERKNEIKDIVIDMLKKSEINSLPVDLGKIAKTYKIECIKADDVIGRGFGGNEKDFDAMTVKSGDKNYIIYNPTPQRTRIRYTIATQLAHIFLSHMSSETEKEALVLEARYFADELLMPLAVLDSYGCRTAEEIATKCDVSMIAGEIRVRDFERRDRFKKQNGETEYDMKFLNVFFGGDK